MSVSFKCTVALCLVGLLHGCGQRPGISSGDDGGVLPPPDGQVGPNGCLPRPDPALPSCSEVRFSACSAAFPSPVTTGSSVQDPHMVWTGWEFLTVHWNTDSFEGRDLVLNGITAEGQVLFTEELEGFSAPRVAWHGDLNMGVVSTDDGMRWLDGCGRPYGPLIEVEFVVDVGGIIWLAKPAVTMFPYSEGMVVVTGFEGWNEPLDLNSPLSYALLGPSPAELDWYPIGDPGPWARPRHVVDKDGPGTWVVASHWMGTHGELLYVEGADVQQEYSVGDMLPPGADGFIVDMIEVSGELYVLFDGRSAQGEWSQWIVQINGASNTTWHFSTEERAVDGMFALGEEIVLVLIAMDNSSDLTVARFDPDSPTGPLMDPIRVGSWAVGGNFSVAPTERGFGFAWKGPDSHLNLQVFDCCTAAD